MAKLRKDVIAKLNDAWLGVDVSNEAFIKPLEILKTSENLDNAEEFYKRLMWLISNTDYLAFFCKHILNIELLPFQVLILQEMWVRRFPMLIVSRGGSKSFLLALYAVLRAVLMPGRKIVAVGAAFRQSKFIHEYMETFWKNAPILRSMCDGSSGPKRDVDMCRMHIGPSIVYTIPVGDGSKIRGLRAQDILSDEFASHSREIFETVIAGFASVSASPAQNVKLAAARDLAQKLGIDLSDSADYEQRGVGNQIVLSGTCDYAFGHFAEYWRRWKSIIHSKGDKKKLREIFNGEVPDGFNWKDYSVIRLPYNLIPKGFMDDSQLARAKATVNSAVFLGEYGACFPRDSMGFFKRSLIESCVGTEVRPVELNGNSIYFDPMLCGHPDKQYVMGLDPASEYDNFSVVVLEINPDHQKLVYCWTTNAKLHGERLKRGLTVEQDYYRFCVRKIRDLMTLFPTIHLALDSQGGGVAIREALRDPAAILPGELPIWPIIDPRKEADTDFYGGLHILELCHFGNADWLTEANHALRMDMETRSLIFPRFDPITIGLSIERDKIYGRGSSDMDSDFLYDTLEDAVMEVEELKNELAIIELTRTNSGRDHWDVPEIKVGVGKKQRLKKDRYSALLMANMSARQITRTLNFEMKCDAIGGFAIGGKSGKNEPCGFSGPAWWKESIGGVYD